MGSHSVTKLGQVGDNETLEFTRDGETVLSANLAALLTSWKGTLHMGGDV